jgi:hypothetical protein
MALSVVDLYRRILPETNCGECGYPTCLAFASMVVSEKLPLKNCPHIDPNCLQAAQAELDRQHAAGKWTRRDMAADALQWARERAASMRLKDLPPRIGGRLTSTNGEEVLALPYFTDTVLVKHNGILKGDGQPLNRWEQVFIYNHLAQGGRRLPTGEWKALEAFPNTVSKIKSMKAHVEAPLAACFRGRTVELDAAGRAVGGKTAPLRGVEADVVLAFRPLPRIPVLLLFWDEDRVDGFDAQAKLLFDETIVDHLDIESILFLSERLRQRLCGDGN